MKTKSGVTSSGAMLSNKTHVFTKACFLTALCFSSMTEVIAGVETVEAGVIRNVTAPTTDSIFLSSGATLNVRNGAVIPDSADLDGRAIDSDVDSIINIRGGEVNGDVSFFDLDITSGEINGDVFNFETPFGEFSMSGGKVVGSLTMHGSEAEISGGTVTGGIFSQAFSHVDIFRGTFLGVLHVEFGDSNMEIRGGDFSGGFNYSLGFEDGGLEAAFTFFGNLSLSTPVADTASSGASVTISGTLLDGSDIDQTIVCADRACSGIVIKRPGEISFEFDEYEISENGSGVTLKINRVDGSDGEVSVDYASTDGSATATTDYEAISGKLTFADGVISRTIFVPILDDGDFEGDEDFSVELRNIKGGAKLGSNSSAQIEIEENDTAPPAGVFKFSGASYSADENDSTVIVTVQRVSGSFGEVTVNYSTSDDTAVAGSDYEPAIGTLTFGRGEVSKAINVSLINDSTFEDGESFLIELSNARGGATLDTLTSAQISIRDDDPVPPAGVLQFGEASYRVSEGGASLAVTITREDGSAGEVTVGFNMVAGTATADEDYKSESGVITLADGDTVRTITVTINDDDSFEGDESFSLVLSNVQGGATLGSISSAEIIIEEDDPAPAAGVLRFSGESYSAAEGDDSVLITVQRVSGSFGDVSVDLKTVDVTAVAGENYQPVSENLTFDDGELSKMIEVPLIDDTTFDGDKTFSVELSNVQGGVTLDVVSSAEVIIEEDEQAPQAGVLQFSGATYNVAEDGNSVVVEITRVSGSAGRVIVDYNTSALTAVAGEDYADVSGRLIFAPGAISRTVVVQISDDETFEGNETFEMTLSNVVGGAVLGVPETTTITINENDPNPDEGNVTTDSETDDATNSGGGDEAASTSSGVTGTSAISPLSLLLLMTCLACFSNRLRKL